MNFDTFPRRNLNPEAEEWGREVEGRIFELENRAQGNTQSVSGLNRSSAASLQELTEKIDLLDRQVQRIGTLYGAIPKMGQETAVANNFAVGSGWSTVASVTFLPDSSGTFQVTATAQGRLVSNSTSTLMGAEIRLVLGGSASPAMTGLPATPSGTWVNNMKVSWPWTVATSAGNPITIAAQVYAQDPASWPSGTGSMMVLSAIGTFTTT